MGGSYRQAVRHSLYPEWVSMNFMMAAMFPVMVSLMMGRDMRAMQPGELVFWGAMSVAVGAGVLVAYPANLWLVAKGLKHGMGTVRALGKGGHSIAADIAHWLTPRRHEPRQAPDTGSAPPVSMPTMKGM